MGTPAIKTVLILSLLAFTAKGAQAAEEKAKATPEQIKKLVDELGAASKDAADRARKRLAEIGPAALSALRKAVAGNKDPAPARAVVVLITRQEQKKLEEQLARRKSTRAIVYPVADASVARVFPAYLVLAVRFPLYPLAVQPRAPLKSQNLFIVDKDGQMDHVTDFKGMEDFFRANIGTVVKESQAREAARAWLSMSAELAQDGYFKFINTVKVGPAKTGLKAIAKATVKPEMGNKGFIEVTMTFEIDGALGEISEKKNLLAGIRPKCQATKLLDPDAVVRAMAEQDILVMGQAAKEYLDGQRAKATPALRREIDRVWKRILVEGR
jgi:hypothetical protein